MCNTPGCLTEAWPLLAYCASSRLFSPLPRVRHQCVRVNRRHDTPSSPWPTDDRLLCSAWTDVTIHRHLHDLLTTGYCASSRLRATLRPNETRTDCVFSLRWDNVTDGHFSRPTQHSEGEVLLTVCFIVYASVTTFLFGTLLYNTPFCHAGFRNTDICVTLCRGIASTVYVKLNVTFFKVLLTCSIVSLFIQLYHLLCFD